MKIAAILPTVADLVDLALEFSDFKSEIAGDADDIRRYADIATELAAEMWEEDNGAIVGKTIPSSLIAQAHEALIDRGYALLGLAEAEAENALRDGIDAGDIDADGEPVPYPRYAAR